ncbi:MAG: NitT/TauT family transport system permease protein [Actinomycetota bacterium]|jgi:NitT/TauT family transport system permease protein|nr:NitT/TauT family transport system permease protein [Actinomycetota bacterium]
MRTESQQAASEAGRQFGSGAIGTSMSLVLPMVSAIVVGLIWFGVVALFDIPKYILPSPETVVASMFENRSALFNEAQATGLIAITGLALSVAFGVPLGFVIARYKPLRRVLMPPIVAIQSIPKVALAPLFVAWLGFGAAPKLIITTLVTFFPLTLATIVGVESITVTTSQLARSIGCRSFGLVRYIWFPSAAPYIAAAFRTAATLAVVGTLVAEFVGSAEGLGNLLLIASGNRDTTLAFAAILVVAALGMVFYGGASLIARGATARLGSEYMRSKTT